MQHETAFYPEQYQGDISKLNYITNLLYDCMKLNQDFKEKIKPVTLYQLSGDYAELKKELKGLSTAELVEKENELKQELFNLRFQLATGQLEGTARIREVRKQIARIKTALRQEELQK